MMDATSGQRADDWRAGVRRLLLAPNDLLRSGALPCSGKSAITEFPLHRDLFQSYHQELLQTLEGALKWWEMMIFAEQQRGRDHDGAVGVVERRTPAGPASNPRIVMVLRKYWLACDDINRRLAVDARVSPAIFLLDWLIQTGDEKTARILARLPFWPMGLDGDGNWD